MKNILYMMNVDWNWIKQRPHFIAEELSKNNQVMILYQYRYKRKGYQKREFWNKNLKPIFVIPRPHKDNVLNHINRVIRKIVLSYYLRQKRAECLYLTFPDQIETIPSKFEGMVVYDCMDNHPAFVKDTYQRSELESQETRLVERANHILVSSEKLKEVLVTKYGKQHEQKITLVRNGYDGEVLEIEKMKDSASDGKKEYYTIAYFGTIGKWFNFEYIQKSIEELPNLHYLLMGPVSEIAIPQSQNIQYIGTVEHDNLLQKVSEADCFMMPFVVNEIIESVDPVKLYEYINFNKDILCVKYEEIERFEPFVHFYTDYSSFVEQLKVLMNKKQKKYSEEQRKTFLLNNNWASRVAVIEKLLG